MGRKTPLVLKEIVEMYQTVKAEGGSKPEHSEDSDSVICVSTSQFSTSNFGTGTTAFSTSDGDDVPAFISHLRSQSVSEDSEDTPQRVLEPVGSDTGLGVHLQEPSKSDKRISRTIGGDAGGTIRRKSKMLNANWKSVVVLNTAGGVSTTKDQPKAVRFHGDAPSEAPPGIAVSSPSSQSPREGAAVEDGAAGERPAHIEQVGQKGVRFQEGIKREAISTDIQAARGEAAGGEASSLMPADVGNVNTEELKYAGV